jgi:hypothetical protein
MPITPSENIIVNTIPMAASFLTLTLSCNHVINSAHKRPEITDPAKNADVEYPKNTKATTMPGKTA